MTRPVEGSNFISTCWTDIAARGYLVAAVDGGADGFDWAYTVGLHLTTGHPELVLVGLEAAMAGGVLDSVGQRVVDGLELHVDEPVRMGPMTLALRRVDPLWRTDGDWFALGRAVLGSKGLAVLAEESGRPCYLLDQSVHEMLMESLSTRGLPLRAQAQSATA
jgi:hypothetical protein